MKFFEEKMFVLYLSQSWPITYSALQCKPTILHHHHYPTFSTDHHKEQFFSTLRVSLIPTPYFCNSRSELLSWFTYISENPQPLTILHRVGAHQHSFRQLPLHHHCCVASPMILTDSHACKIDHFPAFIPNIIQNMHKLEGILRHAHNFQTKHNSTGCWKRSNPCWQRRANNCKGRKRRIDEKKWRASNMNIVEEEQKYY